MATFAKVWQDEVRRLARKEVKMACAGLRKDNTELRRVNALLRKRLEILERGTGRKAANPRAERPAVKAGDGNGADGPKLRVSSKTVRTLRERLGLTQADFATLLGVTGQSIYQWEHKDGRVRMRRGTLDAFAQIRGIGAREARRRLEELAR